jgi:hypothetical protein
MTHEDTTQGTTRRPDYARHAATILGLLVIAWLAFPIVDPVVCLATWGAAALVLRWVLRWVVARRERPFSIEPLLVPLVGVLSIVLCLIERPPPWGYVYDLPLLALGAATGAAALVLWVVGRVRGLGRS